MTRPKNQSDALKPVVSPPTSREVAEAVGISMQSARDRLFQFKRGHIDCDKLYRPKNPNMAPPAPPRNTEVDAIMAATGLSRDGAMARLYRVRQGLMSAEDVMLPRRQIKVDHAKSGDWDFSDLGPRRSIASIPGGTAWERRELGQ